MSFLQCGTTVLASPPVATTFASPISSLIRSIIPSILDAVPYNIPLFIQSTVFEPIIFFGSSRLILGSCDVPLTIALSEIPIPGIITPPM